MANGHHEQGNIPPEDLPENNRHLFEGLQAAAQAYGIPAEDLPENTLRNFLAYVFPRGTFLDSLEQLGFQDIAFQPDGEQRLTYNVQMTAPEAGLTVPALRQQLAQVVEQIPADRGVAWRVVVSVAQIDGQAVQAQFTVAHLEQPR